MTTDPSGPGAPFAADGVSGWQRLVRACRRSGRFDFFLLIAAIFLANVRYWNASFEPTGDAVYIFQPFYIFYNDFFYHGDLTRWFPYGSYGIPAAYWQFYYLSPMAYLTGVLGCFFRIENVLGLFKASLFFEQLVMVWGAYKLCGELFRRRATVFFVCLGLVATTIWYVNPFWNFRVYYLLTLMLYFLLLFFRRRQGHWLWLAVTVFWLSMIGNAIYFSIIQACVLLVFAACLGLRRDVFPVWIFERSRKNILAFLLMALASAVFLYFGAHMLDDVKHLLFGRSGGGYRVRVEDFLSLGLGIHWNKFIELISGGIYGQSTLYLGLLPLVFLVYGLGTNRGRAFAATWIVIVFLVLLSVGDKTPAARVFYFLVPPIRWFRYVGQLGGLIRFFLLIGAGFGLDRFLDKAGWGNEERKRPFWFLGCGLGLFALACFIKGLKIDPSAHGVPWPGFFPLVLTVLAFSLITLNALAGRSARVLGLAALIFFGADMAAYQQFVYQTARGHWRLMPDIISRVHPYDYQPQREEFDRIENTGLRPRVRSVQSFMKSEVFSLFNNETYTFMQFDPCIGRRQAGVQLDAVYRLLVAVSSFQISFNEREEYKSFNPVPSWMGVFACYDDKLRLYPDAALVDEEVIPKLIQRLQAFNLSHTLILKKEAGLLPESGSKPLSGKAPGTVRAKSFTFNRLVADVNVSADGDVWLYYADAWHPGWRAYVDGQRVPIARAYGAFKAVRVGPGRHEVRFEFFDGLRSAAGILMAVMGAVFSGIMIFLVAGECYYRVWGRSAA